MLVEHVSLEQLEVLREIRLDLNEPPLDLPKLSLPSLHVAFV